MQLCIEVYCKFYHYVQSSKRGDKIKLIESKPKKLKTTIQEKQTWDLKFEELEAKLDSFVSMKEESSNYTD